MIAVHRFRLDKWIRLDYMKYERDVDGRWAYGNDRHPNLKVTPHRACLLRERCLATEPGGNGGSRYSASSGLGQPQRDSCAPANAGAVNCDLAAQRCGGNRAPVHPTA